MARQKISLVKTGTTRVGRTRKTAEQLKQQSLIYLDLVNKVRKSRSDKKSNDAFNKIVKMLRSRLEQISYKFHIPGFSFDDIYQEALFALRYKAIKDYDKDRSEQADISPFDRFAVLCVRRHLSTKLKSSYQNRQRVWISSVSLDQNRGNSSSDDSLYLIDIITDTKSNVLDDLDNKEYYRTLFKKLFEKLSDFERQVFLKYCQRLSYNEIVEKINEERLRAGEVRVKVKSIDNALSRIKLKAKEIFEKHGKK